MKKTISIFIAIICGISCLFFSSCELPKFLKSYNAEERKAILQRIDEFEPQGESIIYDIYVDTISYKGNLIKCEELSYEGKEVELLACAADYFYVCAYTLLEKTNYGSCYDLHLLQGNYETLSLTCMHTIANVDQNRYDVGMDKDNLYLWIKVNQEKIYYLYNVKNDTVETYESKHEFLQNDDLYQLERMDMDSFVSNKVAITKKESGETKTIDFSKDVNDDKALKYMAKTFNPFWRSAYRLMEKDGVCYILTTYALEMLCQKNILVVCSYDFETEKLAYHSYIQWNEGTWHTDVIPEYLVIN